MWVCKHCYTDNTNNDNECENCLKKRDEFKPRGCSNTYVEKQKPPSASKEDDGANFKGCSNTYVEKPKPPSAGKVDDGANFKGINWRAVTTFDGNETGGPRRQLSFQRGDNIIVLDMSDNSWWRGQREDVIGWFPAKYVVRARTKDTERQPTEQSKCNLQGKIHMDPGGIFKHTDMFYKVLKSFNGISPYENYLEVRAGITVRRIGQNGDLIRVQYGRNEGWIPSSHVTLIPTNRLEAQVPVFHPAKEMDTGSVPPKIPPRFYKEGGSVPPKLPPRLHEEDGSVPPKLPPRLHEEDDYDIYQEFEKYYKGSVPPKLPPRLHEEDDYDIYQGDIYYEELPPRLHEEDDYAYQDTPYEDLFDEEVIYDEIGPELVKSSFHLDTSIEKDFKKDFRIVMVGKTGSGKSATGNSLLGKTRFEAKMGGQSVTKECNRGDADYDGRRIVVIDTPGLFDTKLSPAKIRENIVKCIHMSLPGPHVFLLILQIGRFTGEEIAAMNHLFEIFGECMAKCSIILFTGLDNLQREDRTIESYIEETGESIQKYIEQCGGRYFAMNNVASDDIKKTMVKSLFTKMDDMVRQNNGSYLTNAIFTDAENNIEEAVKEVKDKEEKASSEEVEKLTLEFEEKIKIIKVEKEHLKQDMLFQKERKDMLAQKKKETTQEMYTLDDDGPEESEHRTIARKIDNLRRERETLEQEENEVYEKLRLLRIKGMDLEDDYDQIKRDRLEEIVEIERTHKINISEAIEKATDDNCRLMNSMWTAMKEIDIQIEEVRTMMDAQMNPTNKKYMKSLAEQEKNLLKEKNKLIRKQSSYFVKVMKNSALLERQLNKKDKMCPIM